MSFIGDEDILWLELSVDDVGVVERSDSGDYFGHYFFNLLLLEPIVSLAEIKEEVSLGKVFHNDVDFGRVLKCLLDGDELVLFADLLYQLALQKVYLFDFGFIDNLHGVAFVGFLFLYEHDIAEGS
jgi:hypothetical protein